MSTASHQQKLTVAITGGTGDIGSYITKAFLALHPTTFTRVVVLTQDPASAKAKALEALGAELIQSQGLVEPSLLKGIDVVVNSWTHDVPKETNNSLYKAALQSGAKVYFPTEFGYDYRIGSMNHRIWNQKRDHNRAAREASAGSLKIIEVCIGAFLEGVFTPWFGLDTENHIYKSLGPGSSTVQGTLTAKADIASSVTRLSILAAADPSSVPDVVRISGDAKSVRELAEIMGRERGETIEVVEEPLSDVDRAGVPTEEETDLPSFLRLLKLGAGRGDVDFSKDNDNELVNPGESLWKWKTVEGFAKEVKGRP